MDSPSDLPSKSIYNIEHLETTEASFSGLVTAKMHGRKKEKQVRGREKDKKINALIASIVCQKVSHCLALKNVSPRSGDQSI